uniref:Uncharacterized protein n=1 Tax=Magnetococcus massalia (strain MO-1) TaxID=451514 RepID=A0A1S7LII9_MAGMO|nr:conserved protein of unknown function [Candidatus Magnetococcus massalia]
MADHIEKKCLKCSQLLRIPKNIGGMVMACPSCGHKMISDFKFGGVQRKKELSSTIFELPDTLLKRLLKLFR